MTELMSSLRGDLQLIASLAWGGRAESMGMRALACSLLFAARAPISCAFRVQALRPTLALGAPRRGYKVRRTAHIGMESNAVFSCISVHRHMMFLYVLRSEGRR